jgi:hypothetical protein
MKLEYSFSHYWKLGFGVSLFHVADWSGSIVQDVSQQALEGSHPIKLQQGTYLVKSGVTRRNLIATRRSGVTSFTIDRQCWSNFKGIYSNIQKLLHSGIT